MMKVFVPVAAAALVILSGCGSPRAPGAQSKAGNASSDTMQAGTRAAEPSTNAAADKPAEQSAPERNSAAGGVSEAWFVGSWSDNADCRDPVEFRADRSFVLPSGSRGTWRLEADGTLVMNGPGATSEARLTRVSDNQVRTDSGDTSYRCDPR